MFFNTLSKVVYSSTTSCFYLSYLRIYLSPEHQRISNKRIGTSRPARSYRNCSEAEYPAPNTLFDVQTLAFCQHQIDRSTTDYACFKHHTLICYSIRRAYFNKHSLYDSPLLLRSGNGFQPPRPE